MTLLDACTFDAAPVGAPDQKILPPRVDPPANWPASRFALFLRMTDNFLGAWPQPVYEDLFVDCAPLVPNVYVASSPAAVRRVLSDNAANYGVAWQQARLCESLFGADSIALSEGPKWRRQRDVLNAGLDARHVAKTADAVRAIAERIADRWRARRGAPIQLDSEFVHVTLRSTAALAVSWFDDDYLTAQAEALTAVRDSIGRISIGAFFRVPKFVPVSARGRAHRIIDALGRKVKVEMSARRAKADFGDDYLGAFLRRQAESNGEIADEEIVSNVITLFASGYDTTATTMCWFAHLLAIDPATQARVRSELVSLIESGAWRDPKSFARLSYSRAALSETLRLYPPLPLLARQAKRADVLDGHSIGQGAVVFISPYIIHRHRRLWDRPDEFVPQRFLTDRSGPERSESYLPFGLGERTCAGFRIANFEILLTFAVLLRAFELRPNPGHPIEIHSRVGMRMRHGIQIYADTRN